jgi:xanthine dehydrogenase accessory factor
MQDIYLDIERWSKQGLPIGLATVTSTWSSSPRQVGAKMAFTTGSRFSGSVSGGCVESAVYEAGMLAITRGETQILQYGISDELAFSVGLSCGGRIEVLVRKLNDDLIQIILGRLRLHKSFTIVSILPADKPGMGYEFIVTETGIVGGNINATMESWAKDHLSQVIHSGQCLVMEPNLLGYEGVRLFIDVINPPPHLVMIGGAHITIPLVKLANAIGYRTSVIDPRRAFANTERFSEVDQIIHAWPQDAFKQVTITHHTAIAILSHDPKIDDPAIKIALESPAFYIGALGSRSTHQKRCQRLLEDGISTSKLNRIHSPIGIDLGSQTPEEVALSILAEIVGIRNSGKNAPSHI